MDDDDEDDFEDDEGDSDDDDDGGVDFERKARQTVARLARQAKESDMEMNTMQDQGFAMPTVEELAAEGEMPADITMLTARVKGTVRLCIYTTNLNPNPNPNPNPNSNPNPDPNETPPLTLSRPLLAQAATRLRPEGGEAASRLQAPPGGRRERHRGAARGLVQCVL